MWMTCTNKTCDFAYARDATGTKGRLHHVTYALNSREENAGARLILAPDWKPIRWTETERKKRQAWGTKTAESFHLYGTPAVPGIPCSGPEAS